MIEKPLKTEYNPYFKMYVSLAKGNVLELLNTQQNGVLAWFKKYQDQKLDIGYAPGKWSPKDLLQHVIDTERIFCFRALSFARGDSQIFPGFNENEYAEVANTKSKPLDELLKEYRLQRENTIVLFNSFNAIELKKIGNTSGGEMSVRAIAFILAGHDIHHFNVLKKRY